MQDKKLRILMIGPHPDDCDFRCGGTAIKYARAGHDVKIISMCSGNCGHWTMTCADLAERRRNEARRAGQVAGILDYEVWDIPDCELVPDLETRKRLVREIREFSPDVLFCVRPNDYHPDHRYSGQLVMDASYLLLVPLFCPDTPAMKRMPVIMYMYDAFTNPPFDPDVVIAIDEVVEQKIRMWDCHVSQVYEWLPYSEDYMEGMPPEDDPEGRLEWLHMPRIPRDGTPIDPDIVARRFQGMRGEYRNAAAAVLFRDKLIESYGAERASQIRFAEAYESCPYGRRLTAEMRKSLFPY